jgi:hypothetical protein
VAGRNVPLPDLVEHRLVGEDAILETYAEADSRRARKRKANREMQSAIPLLDRLCCRILWTHVDWPAALPRCQTYAVDTRELDQTIGGVTFEPVRP